MAAMDLTDSERALVRKILEQAYEGLFHEIHKTDDRAFKASLKREREELATILFKLGIASAA